MGMHIPVRKSRTITTLSTYKATYLVMNGAIVGNAGIQKSQNGGKKKIWKITLYLVEQVYLDRWENGEALVDARRFEIERNKLKRLVKSLLTRKSK